MKLLNTLLIVFLFQIIFVRYIYSQSAEYKWIKQAGGGNNDAGFAVDIDNEGFIYWTGIISDSLVFCDSTMATGFADVFIAKMYPNGKLVWLKIIGGSGWASSYGLKLDSQGNVIVVGAFINEIDFGDTLLNGTGYEDTFVAKYTSGGEFLWALQGTGPKDGYATCVTIDSQNDIIVGGYFIESVKMGGLWLQNLGTKNSFVAKINPSGKVLWLWGNPDNQKTKSELSSITVDSQDDIFFCGYFSENFTAGGTTVTSIDRTDNLYLAKFLPGGNPSWLIGAGSGSSAQAKSVVCDKDDNIYITGNFGGTVAFDGFSLTSFPSGYDAFLAQLNQVGKFNWVYQITGEYNEFANSLSYNLYSGITVAGAFATGIEMGDYKINGHGIYSALFNEEGKLLNFVNTKSIENSDYASAVIIDESNNIYFTGRFNMDCAFGDTTLSSNGLSDAYLAKVHFDNTTGIDDNNPLLNIFSLEQNYPNPFNPTTKIKYSILAPPNLPFQRNPYGKEEVLVQLKIFDILGREVVALVNEEQKPGSYEVEFNPVLSIKNPASGVYFYRLRAGNYIQTRKLIFLK